MYIFIFVEMKSICCMSFATEKHNGLTVRYVNKSQSSEQGQGHSKAQHAGEEWKSFVRASTWRRICCSRSDTPSALDSSCQIKLPLSLSLESLHFPNIFLHFRKLFFALKLFPFLRLSLSLCLLQFIHVRRSNGLQWLVSGGHYKIPPFHFPSHLLVQLGRLTFKPRTIMNHFHVGTCRWRRKMKVHDMTLHSILLSCKHETRDEGKPTSVKR